MGMHRETRMTALASRTWESVEWPSARVMNRDMILGTVIERRRLGWTSLCSITPLKETSRSSLCMLLASSYELINNFEYIQRNQRSLAPTQQFWAIIPDSGASYIPVTGKSAIFSHTPKSGNRVL